MQSVGQNQRFVTFCKNNWAFYLHFKLKVVPLQAQTVNNSKL